jgi:menaquinone-9 beta-reductase
MPRRATKRGEDRTPLAGDYDVIVCGASFAGLTVARRLSASPVARARVLMVDRYDVGERQTSACAAPTAWLERLGLGPSIRQTFGDMLVHAPEGSYRWHLPWTFSTFDYRELCGLLFAGVGADFETATVRGRTGTTVHTDRGDVSAPLVVDALGWRRVLGPGENVQPPQAYLSRGLEVHPGIEGEPPGELELWIHPRYMGPGYSWSFPARDEVRVGVGAFDPRLHVKQPTLRLAGDLDLPADRWQGNWIPHRLRRAAEDGIFFAGDSAGHCLPTTAEGIRPAFYFALALARELEQVVAGRKPREAALRDYGAFHAGHRHAYEALWRIQGLVGAVNRRPRVRRALLRTLADQRLVDGYFRTYLAVCPPEFATAAGWAAQRSEAPALPRAA